MVIMRSYKNCEFLGNCMFVGKRKRINWVSVLHKLDNKDMFSYFFALISKKHKGKSISSNRAAYSTLKHFYSTTTIADLCKEFGL